MKELMAPVTDVKDLGSGVIRSVEWIILPSGPMRSIGRSGSRRKPDPYPCRYVITSKKVKGPPQYTLDIRAWQAGGEVASDAFKLEIPPNAQRLTAAQIPDLDDIPGLFRAK